MRWRSLAASHALTWTSPLTPSSEAAVIVLSGETRSACVVMSMSPPEPCTAVSMRLPSSESSSAPPRCPERQSPHLPERCRQLAALITRQRGPLQVEPLVNRVIRTREANPRGEIRQPQDLKWDSVPPSRFPRCYYAAQAAAFAVEGSQTESLPSTRYSRGAR